MTQNLTSDQVWRTIKKQLFAVLGMVTAQGQSRTVGIVYLVQDGKLYIGTGRASWKARHIEKNPAVSLTVPIPKRIPLAPWVKIPQATISFSGQARVIPCSEASPELLRLVFRQRAEDPDLVQENCLLEVIPQGDFLTYGIGVPLIKMANPALARGRAPVQ